MRLDIDFKFNPTKNMSVAYINQGLYIETTILMKYISWIIIDDKLYSKPKTKDSNKIQNFYHIISVNKPKITEIMNINGVHMFLKNGYYHSYKTYCYYKPGHSGIEIYAKNGVLLTSEEIKFFERKMKINRLQKIISHE